MSAGIFDALVCPEGWLGARATAGGPAGDDGASWFDTALIAGGGFSAAAFDAVVTPAGWFSARTVWAAAWFDRSLFAELPNAGGGRGALLRADP